MRIHATINERTVHRTLRERKAGRNGLTLIDQYLPAFALEIPKRTRTFIVRVAHKLGRNTIVLGKAHEFTAAEAREEAVAANGTPGNSRRSARCSGVMWRNSCADRDDAPSLIQIDAESQVDSRATGRGADRRLESACACHRRRVHRAPAFADRYLAQTAVSWPLAILPKATQGVSRLTEVFRRPPAPPGFRPPGREKRDQAAPPTTEPAILRNRCRANGARPFSARTVVNPGRAFFAISWRVFLQRCLHVTRREVGRLECVCLLQCSLWPRRPAQGEASAGTAPCRIVFLFILAASAVHLEGAPVGPFAIAKSPCRYGPIEHEIVFTNRCGKKRRPPDWAAQVMKGGNVCCSKKR